MASLHEDGYQFIGETAINKLTVPEVRILKEGQLKNREEQKQKQRAQEKTGRDSVSQSRMAIEKSHDENDKKLVEQMASN